MSRYDFSRALEELGVHVDGWEAGALMDRFGVEMEEVYQAKTRTARNTNHSTVQQLSFQRRGTISRFSKSSMKHNADPEDSGVI